MKKIKIGIVGTGQMARIHLHNLNQNKNFSVIGIFGTHQERVSKIANEFNILAYTNYNQILENCQAVIIANLPGHHLDYAVQAAQQGKHLLVEKPIGTNLEQTLELINLCQKKNLKLAVNFQCRANWQVNFLKKLLKDKRLGNIFYAHLNIDWGQSSEYYKLHPGRNDLQLSGGGFLVNQAIHYLDLALMFINNELDEVKSFLDTKKHETQLEDTGIVVIRFKNKSLLGISASNACYKHRTNRLTIHCSHGLFELTNGRITKLEFKKNNLKEKIYYKLLLYLLKISQENFGNYKKILQNFYDGITNDAPLIATGEDGYKSLLLVKKIYTNKIL